MKKHKNIYPLTIIKDRYNGTYSKGKYLAFNDDYYNIPKEVDGEGGDCSSFWSTFPNKKALNGMGKPLNVGRGNSPQDALYDLEIQESKEYR